MRGRFRLVGLGMALAVLCLALLACQKTVPPPAAAVAAPSAAERLAAGKKAFLAGRCATAMPELAEAARLVPASGEAHFYLGLCAAKTEDPKRAAVELGLAAAAAPADPRPLEALGILHYERGQRPEATAALDTAVKRGSKNAQVFYYRGNLAMFAGDCRQALSDYRRAMALDPSFAPAGVEYRGARVACAQAETPAPAGPASKPVPHVRPRPKPAPRPVTAPPAVQAAMPASPASPVSGRP